MLSDGLNEQNMPFFLRAWLPFGMLSAYVVASHWLQIPVCLFKVATHRDCPTCGTTRGLFLLLNGDLCGAVQANPVSLFVMLAVLRHGLVGSFPENKRLRWLESSLMEWTLLCGFFVSGYAHLFAVAGF